MIGVTRFPPLTPDQPNYRPMSQFKPLPPLEELKKAFEYDPDTGFFTHKTNRGHAQTGQTAGSTDSATGYVLLTFHRKKLKAHRVAWLFSTGEDPAELEVDHEDLGRDHNWFGNLRLAAHGQNGVNTISKGWYRQRDRYTACICIAGKKKNLGTYDTPEEAAYVFQQKHIELHGKFSPYRTS